MPTRGNASAIRPAVRGARGYSQGARARRAHSRDDGGVGGSGATLLLLPLCRVGFYPFDDALGLIAGRKQLDVQHAMAQLVTEVPYDTAQALFGDLTGMHFGSERMHAATNQVGAGLTVLDVAPSRQELEQRIAAIAAGRFRRPVLVLGIDGAYLPTRPDSAREPGEGRRGKRARRARWRGQWRDAKGFRFYLLDGERIVHVLSWHQIQNEEQLGQALQQVKQAGLIPEEQQFPLPSDSSYTSNVGACLSVSFDELVCRF